MLTSFKPAVVRLTVIASISLILNCAVAATTGSTTDSSRASKGSSSSLATTLNSSTTNNTGAVPANVSTTTSSTTTAPTSLTTVPSQTSDTTKSTLKAGDTIYLKITPSATTTTTNTSLPLPATRIFTLDKAGVLDLPYIGRFTLAGLTEEEAVLRIKAEPVLEHYTVDLKMLPVEKAGVDALKPFGYSLFDSPPTTFASVDDIPVPADYVIGPNDTVVIQFYGAVNETYTLLVTREGVIDIPNVGPITVAGLTFNQLKKNISERAAKQMIGVSSHVTLGPLRTIRVFVMGDAVRPGSYTVSSLSTLTNALFASGGVTTGGSLRNIQLKRRGRIISRFDLYDLLLKGDTSRDVQLQSGDVIFIPPIGDTASVAGEVNRPAIYELRNEKTISDLLMLAGGMKPTAYLKGTQLISVGQKQDKEQKDLDLNLAKDMRASLKDGDVLVVPSLIDSIEEIVRITGYVKRPVTRAWFEGMKLTDMIPSTHVLLPKPDLDYVVIKRHVLGERQAMVFSVRLGEALKNPESSANVSIRRGDEIIVFGHEVEGDRQNKLAPIIAELERQATYDIPARLVNISGSVYEPGVYPLEEGMRVSDLVRASGNLRETTEVMTAELSRYEGLPGKSRQIIHTTVDLAKVLKGDQSADLVLQPRDYLVIKTVTDWGMQQTVTLSGEVRNPGIYPIYRGETLGNVIKRAGGLTGVAFAEGAVFTRVELQLKEEAHFKELADRIESEMKTTIVERMDEVSRPLETSEITKSLVDLLRNAKSTGRMVIDLKTILAMDGRGNGVNYDVTLMGGDSIFVPQKKDEITVVGEVRKPTTHLFADGYGLEDYIRLSGGLTEKTNSDLVYVVRANGSAVSASSGSSFFGKLFGDTPDVEIHPGDTIVAMLDAEKVSNLKIWRDVVGSFNGLSGLAGLSSIYDRVKGSFPETSGVILQQGN